MDSETCLFWRRGAGLGASLVFIAAALVGCGGGQDAGGASPTSATAAAPATAASATLSAGQVAPAAAVTQMSLYAASRFAEQVSFGPTPALVAEIQAKGFERWIDDQLAVAATPIDVVPAEAVYAIGQNDPVPQEIGAYATTNCDSDHITRKRSWLLPASAKRANWLVA